MLNRGLQSLLQKLKWGQNKQFKIKKRKLRSPKKLYLLALTSRHQNVPSKMWFYCNNGMCDHPDSFTSNSAMAVWLLLMDNLRRLEII